MQSFACGRVNTCNLNGAHWGSKVNHSDFHSKS